ncbi:MAG: F0F1 ATP synthase subunit delta, partial [Bacteroidia bacterium]|nr:F0F1 ATP synthase subunit delta [Bacteroidia bacterium]
MSDTKIAYRYAEALLQKATELNKLGKIAVDMELLNDSCAANSELCGVLKNPVISSG